MTTDRKALADRLTALTTEYGAWIKHQYVEKVILEVAEALLTPVPEEMPIPSQHDIVKAHNDLDQAIGARDYGRLRNFALAMATVREIRKAHSSPQKTIDG